MKDNIIRDRAFELRFLGKNLSEISREINVSRSAIRDWFNPRYCPKKETLFNRDITNLKRSKEHYSYIFGLYLGDGHITKMPRSYRLRIFLDSRDLETNARCKKSLEKMFMGNKVNVNKHKKTNCNTIRVYSKHLQDLFPQHDLGEKWEREISLVDWQKENLISKYFILGLIDSDGSVYKHTDGKYSYTYIEFSNKSKDIINLFCQYLNILKIEHRIRPKSGTALQVVSIRKKKDVALVLNMYKDLDMLN